MEKQKMKYSDAAIWLIPMYQISMKELKEAEFINAYIQDETRLQQDICTLLLFKATEESCMILEDIQMYLDKHVIDIYGHQQKLVVLALRIPEEYKEDYRKIMKGDYSKLSDLYKDLVAERVPVTNESTYKTDGKRLQILIIEKSTAVKRIAATTIQDMSRVQEGEIWEKPRIEDNTLTLEIINKLIEDAQ